MWTARNRQFSQQFFNADNGNPGGGGNQPETPPVPPKEEKVTFTPEQQQHLNNLLAAERKDAEEKTALKLKADADAKAKADQEQRERDEAAARGDFDKVRTDLESKVSIVEQERDALTSEVDALRTYFTGRYDAAVKDLPEFITAFKPNDDADFATKAAWLEKAQEQAAKLSDSKAPGNRPNPKPASGKFDLETAVAEAHAGGKYTA